MEEKDIRQKSKELIENTEAVILSTIGPDGYPYTTAVSNLRCIQKFPSLTDFFATQDHFVQYIATGTSSQKVKHIHTNPRISLYFCKPKSYHGLMLSGDVEIVYGIELKQAIWQKDWEPFWPKGTEDPGFTLLKLSPVTARGWNWDTTFKFDPKG